jgi:hypothetical protein
MRMVPRVAAFCFGLGIALPSYAQQPTPAEQALVADLGALDGVATTLWRTKTDVIAYATEKNKALADLVEAMGKREREWAEYAKPLWEVPPAK